MFRLVSASSSAKTWEVTAKRGSEPHGARLAGGSPRRHGRFWSITEPGSYLMMSMPLSLNSASVFSTRSALIPADSVRFTDVA